MQSGRPVRQPPNTHRRLPSWIGLRYANQQYVVDMSVRFRGKAMQDLAASALLFILDHPLWVEPVTIPEDPQAALWRVSHRRGTEAPCQQPASLTYHMNELH